MSSLRAILISMAIIVPCLLVGFASPTSAKVLVAAAVISTSAWAARDSAALHVREYKSTLAAIPFVLFTACVGLWIVVFPVYLVVRGRVVAGLLPKAENAHERRALYLCIALWSILGITMVAMGVMAYILSAVMQTGPMGTA
jgi:hypothetical protein